MKRFFISLMMLMVLMGALSASNAEIAIAQGSLSINPIVDLKVVTGNTSCGTGWEKVPTNLNLGAPASAPEFYLCVKRGTNNPITHLYIRSIIITPPVIIELPTGDITIDPPDLGDDQCESGDTRINTNVNEGQNDTVFGPQKDYFCYRRDGFSALVDVQFVKINNPLDKWTLKEPPFPITNFNGGGTPLYVFTRNAVELTKLGCGGEGETPCTTDHSFRRQNGNLLSPGCDRGLTEDFIKGECINTTRHSHDNVIDSFDNTWAGWALANQEEQLAVDEPFNWVMHINTHGSFNTRADGYIDPNQHYSVSDQLEGGVRIVDMDLRIVDGALRVCHGTEITPISDIPEIIIPLCIATDRLYFNFIKEIGAWLDDNPGEIIYVKKDNLHDPTPPPTTLSNPIRLYLGHLGVCTDADPNGVAADRWPTRREMLAAGRRVIVSEELLPGATSPSCKIPAPGFSEPDGHTCPGGIRGGNWEDRTGISSFLDTPVATVLGRNDAYPGLYTDDDVRARAQCNQINKDIDKTDPLRASIRFDYVHAAAEASTADYPFDVDVCKMGAIHRLIEEGELTDSVWPDVSAILNYSEEAWNNAKAKVGETVLNNSKNALCPDPDNRIKQAVWSWEEGDKGDNGAAALFNRSDGRWSSANPDGEHHFACARPRVGPPETWPDPTGAQWRITVATGTWYEGGQACQDEFPGLVFAVPVNGWQNERLKAADIGSPCTGCPDALPVRGLLPQVNNFVWLNYNDIDEDGVWVIQIGPSVETPTVSPEPSDEGQVVNASATFSDNEGDTHTCTVDFGDGSGPQPGSVNGNTCNGVHLYFDNGDYTVTVTVTDSDGLSDQNSIVHTVNNVAPTVEAGPDQEVNEGDIVSLAPATFTDPGTRDTHMATIDWGDGTPVDTDPKVTEPHIENRREVPGTVSGSHVYADNGLYTVEVCVKDNDGGETCDSLIVTVNNVAPTVNLPTVNPEPSDEGSPATASATFSDPGQSDTHTCIVNYGDGSGSQSGVVSGNTCTGPAHVYADDGSYPVVVIVTDKDGGMGPSNPTFHLVNNVPPTVDPPTINPEPSVEGSSVVASATASDPGGINDAPYSCTVDYGDGSGPQAGNVAGNTCTGPGHTYADNGDYLVKVSVTDKDGGTGQNSSNHTVINIPPMVDAPIINPEPSEEGSPATASATFSDPGANDAPYSCAVDYGDGTGPQAGTVAGNTCTGPAYVYADDGSYPVVVIVTDKDGSPGSSNPTVHSVTNVAPTVDAGADQTVNEGDLVSLAPATFTDPGAADTHTATIDWGDGTVDNNPGLNEPSGGADGTVIGDHAYADNGSYTVTVCVEDDDGAEDCDSLTVIANNVAPTADFANTTPLDIFQGESATLVFTNVFDPGTADTFIYSYDCTNDGSFEHSGGSPTFDCPYHDHGTFTARGRIEDDDGGFNDYTVEIIVLSPQEAAQTIIDKIQEGLCDAGVLNKGQCNSLTVKLENAIKQLDNDKSKPATNQVEALINEVNGYMNGGILTSEQGQEIIDLANRLIASIASMD